MTSRVAALPVLHGCTHPWRPSGDMQHGPLEEVLLPLRKDEATRIGTATAGGRPTDSLIVGGKGSLTHNTDVGGESPSGRRGGKDFDGVMRGTRGKSGALGRGRVGGRGGRGLGMRVMVVVDAADGGDGRRCRFSAAKTAAWTAI